MKSWEEFKAEIQAHFPEDNTIYQPILHPDFKDWKVSRPSKETLDLILTRVGKVDGKKVLDLGCALGYHSHMLARRGAIVTGIDMSSKRIEFSRYLSNIYGFHEDNPAFYNSDIFDFVEANQTYFDIVLFLNTIHWLFAQRGKAAWESMKKISEKSNVMFLTYDIEFAHGFSPENCIKLTDFTNVENIGFPRAKAKGPPRQIYRFWKGGHLPDIMDIDVQDLWDNTYNREDRIQPSYYNLGLSHLSTADSLMKNTNTPVESLSLYEFMQSKDYELITARKTNINKIINYLNEYKKTMINLKNDGYNNKKSMISFMELYNTKPAIRDGHRRLNCILAIGEEKIIKVKKWELNESQIKRRISEKLLRLKNKINK